MIARLLQSMRRNPATTGFVAGFLLWLVSRPGGINLLGGTMDLGLAALISLRYPKLRFLSDLERNLLLLALVVGGALNVVLWWHAS